jgi:large subunit ribosomal protein L31e
VEKMERIYTIPLRRGTMTAPRTRRAKKAIFVLKDFIEKHMKSSDIKISEKLNLHIWSQGMRNPIMRVKVNVTKDDKGTVFVKLFGEEAAKKDAKSAKKTSAVQKAKPVVKKAPVVDAEVKENTDAQSADSSADAKPKVKRVVKKKTE